MSEEKSTLKQINMDMANLYREESYTDLKVGGVRKLVPIKSDGTDDETRAPVFSGHTQVMSPHGPLPIHGSMEGAKTLEEAILAFPKAMEEAMNRMVEEAQKLQSEQASKIITPDDLKKDSGLIV